MVRKTQTVPLAEVDPEARVRVAVEIIRSDVVTVDRVVGALGRLGRLGHVREISSHPEGGLSEVETEEKIDRDLGHIHLAAPKPFHRIPIQSTGPIS